MRPAASYSDGFRFEKGNKAEGLFYDSNLSTSAAFIDDFVILERAGSLLASAAAVSALSAILF